MDKYNVPEDIHSQLAVAPQERAQSMSNTVPWLDKLLLLPLFSFLFG